MSALGRSPAIRQKFSEWLERIDAVSITPPLLRKSLAKRCSIMIGVNILRGGAAGRAQNLLEVEDRHARLGLCHRDFGQIPYAAGQLQIAFLHRAGIKA